MAGSQAGDLGSVPRGLHNARPQGSDGLGFLWDTRCRPAAPWGQQPLSWNAGHRQGPAGGPEYLRRLAGQDMRAPGPGSSLPSGKGHFLSLSLSWPSPSLPATGCWSLSFCSSGMWGDSAAPRGVREPRRRQQPRAGNVLLAGGPTCRWLSSPLASCLPVGAGTRGGSPRALSLTPPCSLSTQAPRGPRRPPGPQEQVCRPDMWTRQGQCPGAGSALRGPSLVHPDFDGWHPTAMLDPKVTSPS